MTMRKYVCAAPAVAGLLGGAILALSTPAAAQALAACPSDSSTVYVSGSSAFQPVLIALANVLGSSVKIVYQKPGSCEGLQFILKNTADTDSAFYVAPGTTSATFNAAQCSLAGGMATIDVGASDVYGATCTAGYDPNLPAVTGTFKDFPGPVQAMAFVQSSSATMQHTISAEAAYMVFGFGAKAGQTPIPPWSTTADIFVRKNDSGTLQMLGKAIGLLGSKWQQAGTAPSVVQGSSTQDLVTKLIAQATMSTADGDASIGILSTSGLAAGTQPIAFQGTGQSCSYYPSSTASKSDLVNVRQGRYVVWGPEHLVTNVDGSGNPVGKNSNTAAVQALINAAVATSQAPAVASDAGIGTLTETQIGQVIDAISSPTTGFIPTCAMQVSRTTEIGAEASYAPPAACICRFEQSAGMPTGHSCTQCTADTGCSGATPKCHFGYCEAE
jgi:hypothetical protein